MSDSRAQIHAVTPDVLSLAMAVGPKASLLDVRLVQIVAKINSLQASPPTLARPSRAFSFQRNDPLGQAMVSVKFGFDLVYDSGEPASDPAVGIEGVYGLLYQIEDLASLDDQTLAAFAELNGFYNAWPFWRELVHSTLGRMGFGPSTMPTFRIKTTVDGTNATN